MNDLFLPLSVWLHVACANVRSRVVDAWEHREDETGFDEAVTKMIWLAIGVGVAVAATVFFVGVFDAARSEVPDPIPAEIP